VRQRHTRRDSHTVCQSHSETRQSQCVSHASRAVCGTRQSDTHQTASVSRESHCVLREADSRQSDTLCLVQVCVSREAVRQTVTVCVSREPRCGSRETHTVTVSRLFRVYLARGTGRLARDTDCRVRDCDCLAVSVSLSHCFASVSLSLSHCLTVSVSLSHCLTVALSRVCLTVSLSHCLRRTIAQSRARL